MRTSSYVIHVDIPDQPDHVLVIQGYSGAYDVVSRPVAEFLRAHEPERHAPAQGEWPAEARPSNVATPSDETLALLRKRGYLTDSTITDERERVRGLANLAHAGAVQSRPQYVFMMSYDCNLRCGYCFQDHMRTDPAFRHLLRTMDPAMIDRCMRAMRQIDAKHRRATSKRQITLFGGEPLLAVNRPIVEYLLEQLEREGGSDVHAVTNATELHHYFDLLRPGAIDTFQVTIDGPQDEHDRRRIRADRSGSFDKILENLAVAVDLGVLISVRINTDRINVERLPELARVFHERGIDKPNVYIYTAAVHAANEQTDKRDTFNQYALTKRMRELRADHPEMSILCAPTEEIKMRLRRAMKSGEPWSQLRASYCGAHNAMYVFDPFGDIYACWERTGDPSIRMGRIDENGEVKMQRSMPDQLPDPARTAARKLLPVLSKPRIAGEEAWRSRTIATNDTCLSCKYAFYCGGGCAAEAIDHKHEYYANNCSGFQEKFRVAAAETFVELRSGLDMPDVMLPCDH